MIEQENYDVTMDQVLSFSRESFSRLLKVLEPQVIIDNWCFITRVQDYFLFTDTKSTMLMFIELQGLVSTELITHHGEMSAVSAPAEIVKLENFLSSVPQVLDI